MKFDEEYNTCGMACARTFRYNFYANLICHKGCYHLALGRLYGTGPFAWLRRLLDWRIS